MSSGLRLLWFHFMIWCYQHIRKNVAQAWKAKKKLLFGSISQFCLEQCISKTSFALSVSTAPIVRELLCVLSNKVSGRILFYFSTLDNLLSRVDKSCENWSIQDLGMIIRETENKYSNIQSTKNGKHSNAMNRNCTSQRAESESI